MVFDKNDYFLAASPDGLIGCTGIVERKCPYTLRGLSPEISINSNKVPYFKMINGQVEFKKTHPYYYQIQGQLRISNREYCLFGMWTSDDFDMQILRIERDDEFFENNMKTILTGFYENYLLPEIIDSRITRNMKIRNPIEDVIDTKNETAEEKIIKTGKDKIKKTVDTTKKPVKEIVKKTVKEKFKKTIKKNVKNLVKINKKSI